MVSKAVSAIIGQGIDLVETARIERVWQRHGDAFLARIYTLAERDYCLKSKIAAQRLAGRWAAKEAVLKLLGTGWRGGIEFSDIEVLPDKLGRPLVTLHNRTVQLAESLGIRHVLVSISHAGDYAMASAIGVGE